MANSQAEIRELRFILKPQLTEAFALVDAYGDSPIGVQGWHHKTFPASESVLDILTEWIGKGDYLLSGLDAPPKEGA